MQGRKHSRHIVGNRSSFGSLFLFILFFSAEDTYAWIQAGEMQVLDSMILA